MFRPQYFNRTPKGYQDRPFVKPVTYGQNLTGGILAGEEFRNYIVQMDHDAPQLIRSIFWQGANQGQSAGALSGSIQVQIVDPFNVDRTDGYIPLWLLAWGSGINNTDGGSGRCKVFEPEIYCPVGSVIKVNYFNPDGASYQYPGLFEFRGVKRFPEGCQ